MIGRIVVVASVLIGCSPNAALDIRPNFLFIMTDDHATQMMSAYGSTRAETPNLDRIAEEGMLFVNSFCTNALCAPSRAVVLTGKYSHRNGQRFNSDVFDGSQETFPKMLQQAGYQTALVGKWHLNSEPTGFDYWNILEGQGEYIDPTFLEMGAPVERPGYVTDIITEMAMDWIRERDRSRPFLLLYHHKAPHAEWVPDAKHASLFAGEPIAEPESFSDDQLARARPLQLARNKLVPDLLGRWREWGALAGKAEPGEILGEELKRWMYQQYVKDYLRVLRSVDENVGRMLDFLEEHDLDQNTMVIYTSDNGVFVGEHALFDKRLMYEESQRIPLAIRFPSGIAAGSRTQSFALNVDYAATILDYAGVPIPAEVQGRSLRPILEGEPPEDWRSSIYYHYYDPPREHNVSPHFGIRTARYKLIRYYESVYGGESEWELIDLDKDPMEYRNVYADQAYAPVVLDLQSQLIRKRMQLLEQ